MVHAAALTFSEVTFVLTVAFGIVVAFRGPEWARMYVLTIAAALVGVTGFVLVLAATA